MIAGEETIEHLRAKAAGGTGKLENLVLCHKGCNAHLKDRPLERKLRIRAQWHRAAQHQAAADPDPRWLTEPVAAGTGLG
jgi:hypothetical protein